PPLGRRPGKWRGRRRAEKEGARRGGRRAHPAVPLGSQVAIKRVARDRISQWGELPSGSRVPLEIVLLNKVGSGFHGVIQLLDWFELPDSFVVVMERP
ncbi:PIM1 kinase, partial [Panurus biarmicus]|nr:PIM1 kinase [Panurus biarmicus]